MTTAAELQRILEADGWSIDISKAPHDKPILGWCDHESDAYSYNGGKTLTLYAAHADGLSCAYDGPNVLEFGGGWADSYEDGGGWLPDWWFVRGSEFECVANPIAWKPITYIAEPS